MRTRVGYTGGKGCEPSYHHMQDHTESIQIEYDEEKTTLEELLDLFWKAHNPHVHGWGRQYKCAVWCLNEEQKNIAIASKKEKEKASEHKIKTEILMMTTWTNAEDYHQKFYLRSFSSNHGNILGLLSLKTEKQIRESEIAARLNGYCTGKGSLEMFQMEVARWESENVEGWRELPAVHKKKIVSSIEDVLKSGKRKIMCVG